MSGDTFYQSIPGFGKYLKSDELLNRFSLSELKQVEKQYNTLVNIDSTNQFPIEALKKFDKRAKDYNVFSSIKWPMEGDEAVSLCKKIKEDENNEHSRTIIEAINSCLEPRVVLEEKFDSNLKEINSKHGKQKASSLTRTKTEQVKAINSEIKAQQQEEIQDLKNLFNKVSFTNALKELLKIKPEDDFDLIKNNMISVRQESHKKQLEEFEATTHGYLIKCHNDPVGEANRLFLIAAFYKNDAEMREMINEQIRKHHGLSTQVSENKPDDKSIDFSVVDLDALVNKMGIITDVNSNKCAIKLDEYLSIFSLGSTLEYLSPYQKIQAKVDILARTMKAKGVEDVTITVQFSDKEIALERARQTYAAFVKAGYDPEQFIINVNGDVYKSKLDPKADPKDKKAKLFRDIFTGHDQEYLLINQTAEKNKSELQQLGLVAKKAEDFKKEIGDLKQAQPKPDAQNQPPSNMGKKQ